MEGGGKNMHLLPALLVIYNNCHDKVTTTLLFLEGAINAWVPAHSWSVFFPFFSLLVDFWGHKAFKIGQGQEDGK